MGFPIGTSRSVAFPGAVVKSRCRLWWTDYISVDHGEISKLEWPQKCALGPSPHLFLQECDSGAVIFYILQEYHSKGLAACLHWRPTSGNTQILSELLHSLRSPAAPDRRFV